MELLKLPGRLIKIENWKVRFPVIAWYILAATGAVLKIRLGESRYNNFIIFRQVFWHTVHQTNLYAEYPLEYFDTNHYGPFFSVVIAPFVLMPAPVGVFFWCLSNAAILIYAIRKLPVSFKNQNIILLIGAVEMMTSIENAQFNCIMASWIILSYVLVQKEKDFWAALFIAAGFLVKLYGIVGLCFFLFSKHKREFILGFVFWLCTLFLLPMVISSFSFVMHSYIDWYHSLLQKNAKNLSDGGGKINLSVMGLAERIFNIRLSNSIILIPAAILQLIPAVRFTQFRNIQFRLQYLALMLIGVVIFSTSSESPTYIIAMTGVGIWFILQEKNAINITLLAFAIVITSMSPTDFFPKYIKENYVFTYGLKALPCFLIWLSLLYHLTTKKFNEVKFFNEKKHFDNNTCLQ